MQRNQLRKKMQRNQWMLGSKRGRLNQKVGGQGDFGGADKLLHRLHPYVHLLLQREEGGMGKGRVQEIITTVTNNLIASSSPPPIFHLTLLWFRLIVSVQHHPAPLAPDCTSHLRLSPQELASVLSDVSKASVLRHAARRAWMVT